MTQNEITKIAKEVGFSDEETDKCQLMFERFAHLVIQQEREACAKIVESNADACMPDSLAQMYLYSNATAIRARGQS
jgi:hypothetical protein